MKMTFDETNLNPKGKRACDCVVRAVAYATNQTWADTYMEMAKMGIKNGLMLNEKALEEKYLKSKGFIKFKQPKKINGKKYTIKEWAEEVASLQYDNETIVIRVNKHMTILRIIDGLPILIDTWSCGSKYINNYYIKH